MSSSPITVTVPVVIWSKDSKSIHQYQVSMHTTFQDIISALQPEGIHAALVGKKNYPFRLMPCDFVPDVTYKGGPPTSRGDIFIHGLVMIVGWMNYLEDRYCSIKEAITDIEEIYAHPEKLPEVLKNLVVHLFTYNHREIDCCDDEGPWTERDPDLTTAADTLWLRLEQEFLLNRRRFDKRLGESDWAHATLALAIPATCITHEPGCGVSALLWQLHALAH